MRIRRSPLISDITPGSPQPGECRSAGGPLSPTYLRSPTRRRPERRRATRYANAADGSYFGRNMRGLGDRGFDSDEVSRGGSGYVPPVFGFAWLNAPPAQRSKLLPYVGMLRAAEGPVGRQSLRDVRHRKSCCCAMLHRATR